MMQSDIDSRESSAIHTPESPFSAAQRVAEQIPVRIPYLDGWRGLAIIAVLVGHFGSPYWRPLAGLGGFGVDLFFVLSGRLMADILFVSRQPLPLFFRRRFARIFPALLLFATAMAIVSVLSLAIRGKSVMQPWEYGSALTFTINYAQALTGQESRLLAHIWSLSVEEHCYVIFAILALVLSRRINRAKWILAIIGLAALLRGVELYSASAGNVHETYWRTDVRLAPAFLSAATFLWLRDTRLRDRPSTSVLGWLPLPFVALSGCLFLVGSVPVMYASSALLLAVAVNTLDFSAQTLLRVLSGSILTRFGLLSYSIYLWQQPVFRFGERLSGLLLLPVAVVLGVASYNLVERPARRWLNSLSWGRQQSIASGH